MQGDWLNVTLTNTDYNLPTPKEALYQYTNWLITQGYTYSNVWSYDFAPGSELRLPEMPLVHEYNYHDGGPKVQPVTYQLYRDTEAAVLVQRKKTYQKQSIAVKILATSEKKRAEITELIRSGLKKYKKVIKDDKINVGFWRVAMPGGDRFTREIDYYAWDKIAGNYPSAIRGVLSELFTLTPETLDGKIGLLYGCAGTGKTTLLCSLAHAWRDWADMEYIIDPEVFLNDASYITDVLLGKYEMNERYRMVILEDAGELIKDDAKKSTGQALSRLLNMTDGILGSGRKVIVMITTNDDVATLHPAITRPGRCFVKAEIGKFAVGEAQAWIGNEYTVPNPVTLAEMYHIQKGMGQTVLGTREKSEEASPYL